jgi:amidase
MSSFNPLTAAASDLQDELVQGNLRSVNLVDVYLSQIARHNDYLHAVIVTAPRASLMQQAERLDKERLAGFVRSPLHGIPILLKVGQFFALSKVMVQCG